MTVAEKIRDVLGTRSGFYSFSWPWMRDEINVSSEEVKQGLAVLVDEGVVKKTSTAWMYSKVREEKVK